jgi:hypothetical protein
MTGSGVAETNAKKQSAAKDFIVATVATDGVDLENRRRGKGVVLFGDSKEYSTTPFWGWHLDSPGNLKIPNFCQETTISALSVLERKMASFKCCSLASL